MRIAKFVPNKSKYGSSAHPLPARDPFPFCFALPSLHRPHLHQSKSQSRAKVIKTNSNNMVEGKNTIRTNRARHTHTQIMAVNKKGRSWGDQSK